MSRFDERLVLVEGYDDRAFWKGLLIERAACTEARKEAKTAEHRHDGMFTYLTPSGALLHVIPVKEQKQQSEVSEAIREKLRNRAIKRFSRLVVSPDLDGRTLDDGWRSIRSAVLGVCPDATETTNGDFSIDEGERSVSAVFLHADSSNGNASVGVPVQRALEQLVCAALCEAYPARGEAVARWLASRGDPKGKDHKAHAWSFYAGWWTDHGTGDFFSCLWRDPPVAAALEAMLRKQGAWRIIEALLAPPVP